MIEEKVFIITSMMENNMWFWPVMAFVSGLLISLTPCSLASIPMIISLVSGSKNYSKKRAFSLSVIFALGMATVYSALGAFASALGEFFHHLGAWWYYFLGTLLLLMALQIMGIINIIPGSHSHIRPKGRGRTGAFLTGMMGGFFASHCALPVLVVLLALSANKGNILSGLVLLLSFALGHSVFVIVAGTYTSVLERFGRDPKYHKVEKYIRLFIGLAVILLALYLIIFAANNR